MLKLYAVLFIAVVLAQGCVSTAKILSQESYAADSGILDDANAWDFGSITAGENLKHVFIVKNNSKKNMQIGQIDTSCGCTVSKIDKKILLPSESALLEISFNSKGYRGAVQQYVYVQTDNLDNPILRFIIKADVR